MDDVAEMIILAGLITPGLDFASPPTLLQHLLQDGDQLIGVVTGLVR